MPESIDQIITGCKQKEHKYQKILYEKYRGYALKIVFRYIYRYEKAIDAVNDGFVRLFNNFENFIAGKTGVENEKILMGYLKRIMINISIDHLRKGNMLPEIGGISDDVWEVADERNNADNIVLYNELIAQVKNLPPNYRVVFNLYLLDGYKHNEIADMLDTSIGNSKSILSRARVLLQKSIETMENAQLCRS